MRTVTCCIQYILPRLCHLVSWVKASVRYTIALVLFLFFLLLQQNSFGQTATASWVLTANGNPVTTGNISAAAISGGSGISNISTNNTNGAYATGWNSANLDTIDYFEYKVSPVPGYDLTITSISFQHFCTSNQSETGAIYYSTDEFSKSSPIGDNFTIPKNPQTTTNLSSLNITVANGQTLTIRIYAWKFQKENYAFYNKNVIVSGTTATSASPTLNISSSNIGFGYVQENTTSSEMSYQISGENLNGSDIAISSPGNFEISLSSGSGFSNSLTLAYSGNTLPETTIYCRFKPTAAGIDYSGNISHTGGGAVQQNLAVTGTTLVDCTSGAVSVFSSTGVTNPEYAIGDKDFTGATLAGNSGVLTLDLTGGVILTSGKGVDIYWNSGHPSQAGSILTETSKDASSWFVVNTYTVNSGGWTTQNITLSADTRYIRFTTQNSWDVLIDAAEFDPPPVIICPTDITDMVDPGSCTASGVDLGTPSTADNCGIADVTNNSSEPYSLGTTTIIWTATDIAGNTANCTQKVIITPEDFDVALQDLMDFCQTGHSGTTTITWNISLLNGTSDWTYDYTINDGTINVASGTGVNATGDITISYVMTNKESDKTFTLTLSNVKDNCGVSEAEITNNTDAVKVYAVPATGEIIPD